MSVNYKKLGEIVELIDERNKDGKVQNLIEKLLILLLGEFVEVCHGKIFVIWNFLFPTSKNNKK